MCTHPTTELWETTTDTMEYCNTARRILGAHLLCATIGKRGYRNKTRELFLKCKP